MCLTRASQDSSFEMAVTITNYLLYRQQSMFHVKVEIPFITFYDRYCSHSAYKWAKRISAVGLVGMGGGGGEPNKNLLI